MTRASHIRFGAFELALDTGEIRKRGQRIKLRPQAFRVLAYLAGAPGQLLTREMIRSQVWGDDTFVDFEHGLNFCIREVRRVLGDAAAKPRYIETLPRRGYRFIAATSNGEPAPPVVAAEGTATPIRTDPDELRNQAYQHYGNGRKSLTQIGKDSLEEACLHFERALKLEPDYALAHSGLGTAYVLRTTHRRDAVALEQAQIHLERALELDPELAEPYPWLCLVYIRKSNVAQALAAGHRGIQLQPALAQAHYFLGLAYFVSLETTPANYQSAANHLLQATVVEPAWQPAWFVLASLAALTGEYDHAEGFAQRLIQLNREGRGLPFIGAEIILGSIHLRRGNAETARGVLSDFNERLSQSNHMYADLMNALAICGLGDVDMREGRVVEALAIYRRAWQEVQEHPRMMARDRIAARVLAGLASAYAANRELDRASGLLSRAVRLLEENKLPEHAAAGAGLADLFYSMAAAYARLGDVEQVLCMLNGAVQSGWRDASWTERDPELRIVHGQARFVDLLRQMRESPGVRFESIV